MRRILIAGALAMTAAMAGCATPTPYQPNVPGQAAAGGYSETALTADRYRVTFNGNTLTSRDTVENYMLYRAAELTLSRGYDWFELDDRRTNRDQQTYVEPDPLAYGPRFGGGYGFWRPTWRYYGRGFGWRSPIFGDPFWNDQFDVTTVQKFEASAEITLHKGPPPAGANRAFDARQVQANLEPKIVRPTPKA